MYIIYSVIVSLLWITHKWVHFMQCSRSDWTINRDLFRLHMHSIWHGIKRSWHSTLGGSEMVLRECRSHTDNQHALYKWRWISVGKGKKKNMNDKDRNNKRATPKWVTKSCDNRYDEICGWNSIKDVASCLVFNPFWEKNWPWPSTLT